MKPIISKRPPRSVSVILAMPGEFTPKQVPVNNAQSLCSALAKQGRLRLVHRGVLGCQGSPATYTVAP